jgi:hypothetical protein
MIITLSSCKGKEKIGFNDRDKLNLQVAEKIVSCINSKDVEGLYSLFSEDVRTNDKTLKNDISKILDYLNGKIDSYEKWAVASTTDIEKSKNSTNYESKYKIKVNNVLYYMYYDNTVKNDFDNDKVGLYFLKIFKVEDKDKYFCYWEDINPGIFLPDEAK